MRTNSVTDRNKSDMNMVSSDERMLKKTKENT